MQLFHKQKGKPLYLQLYEWLKEQILEGYLAEYEKMPSVRTCAKMYQLSMTSVLKAYEKLLEEGFIESKEKSGYYVSVNAEKIELRKKMQLQQKQLLKTEYEIDLRSHSVGRLDFDQQTWNRCLKEALEYKGIEQYGNPQGEEVLRIALQKHAYEHRNVLCDMKRMIVGSSIQSLLFILAGLLPRNCVVAMEEGAFLQAQFVFEQYGFEVLSLKRLKQGLDMDALYKHRPHVLYVNVNSCGSSYQELTSDEKQALIQWALENHAMIIEDDHNGELHYRHESSSSMQGRMNDAICYIGSFSRILLPSIRISYMILPKKLYQLYALNQYKYGPTSSKIEQIALSEYIMQGHMQRHIKRLKKRYAQKSIALEACLKQYFPDANIQLKEASLAYVLNLYEEIDAQAFIQEAQKHQIAIEATAKTIVIGFTNLTIEQLENTVNLLKNIYCIVKI